MIRYVSTKGTIQPVDFDQAVLQGFAEDGGLFVPEEIPKISKQKLSELSQMSYSDLAFEMLTLFIHPKIIPQEDLKQLIRQSFSGFEHPDLIPIVPLDATGSLFSMELFHGPTLSFKDIAMGFLINTMDYFLQKQKKHLSIILATTGDTGPAAAHASVGKETIDCWPIYPAGMISREQERQMTTLGADNVHPVAAANCKDGGDDIDRVVAKLFATPGLKEQLDLSSVNSINWCRVMVQSIHYAYGYFRVCDHVGDPVDFCVPSGAFGNLFAGFLAREMGIPIGRFICANNSNQTLHRVFSTGLFKKEELRTTISSAIDIVIPYNFWRFLYFSAGCDPVKIRKWMDLFEQSGEIRLNMETQKAMQKGFTSCSMSDEITLSTIRQTWEEQNYLLDPHGAVAVAAAKTVQAQSEHPVKTVCLTTAHPAKFPGVIEKALSPAPNLPIQACHPTLVQAKELNANSTVCDIVELEQLLVDVIEKRKKERS